MLTIKIKPNMIEKAKKSGVMVWTEKDYKYFNEKLRRKYKSLKGVNNIDVGTVIFNNYCDSDSLHDFIMTNKNYIERVHIKNSGAINVNSLQTLCKMNKIKLINNTQEGLLSAKFNNEYVEVILDKEGETGFFTVKDTKYYRICAASDDIISVYYVIDQMVKDGLKTNILYILLVLFGIKVDINNLSADMAYYAKMTDPITKVEISVLKNMVDNMTKGLNIVYEKSSNTLGCKDKNIDVGYANYILELVNLYSNMEEV